MKINDAVYGGIEVNDPVLLELLETKPVQRIKHISQSGTNLVQTEKTLTRYDHCVGAMLLLRKYGASVEEQIAGLLHDVPHTAFSHAADFVFKERDNQTYHERFLKKIVFDSEIPAVLIKYDIDPERVVNEANFSLLEQEIPALCADRIDYSLRDMFVDSHNITKEEVKTILDALTTHEGRFVMSDAEIALDYARRFMNQCLTSWNAPQTLATFEILAHTIRMAFDEKVLLEQDLFGTDRQVVDKLKAANNPMLNKELAKLTPNLQFEFNETDFDYETRGKARYIDPPILIDGQVINLSKTNKAFAQEIPELSAKVKKGYRIKVNS